MQRDTAICLLDTAVLTSNHVVSISFSSGVFLLFFFYSPGKSLCVSGMEKLQPVQTGQAQSESEDSRGCSSELGPGMSASLAAAFLLPMLCRTSLGKAGFPRPVQCLFRCLGEI